MTRHRVVGTVALVLLAVGCGSTSGRQEVPATVLAAAPEPTAEVRDLVLPLDGYQLSVNEIYLIETAKDVLTRDCMKRQGYDWEVIDDRGQYPDLRNRRRYGLIETAVATEMGYRTNPRLMGSTDVTARKADRENRLGAAERAAALAPGDGCYPQAGDRLARGNQPDEDLVGRLNSGSLDEALNSPEGVRVTRAWARCMAEQGYTYKDFYAAAEDPRWARSKTPSAAEKQTAQADVACKQRVGLVKALSEEERGIQERDIRAHQAYFTALKSAKDRHLAAARAVLDRR
ncbi:hypothetical protein ACWD5R_43600 [Streptomyces sp. NPDC002514]|uniref:hypothetical protein n=1 Tax=Streptomyces sp. NPDC001270 TaxID=3364554 RepID=UPI0036B9BBC1